jgi:hypothetical protein
VRFRVCFTLVSLVIIGWITWDWAGPLDGKWRPLVGMVGEYYVEIWHLQGYSPSLCWLRNDGLAPASKYWTYWSHAGDMGPVSRVACYRQMFSFLYYFIGWLRRETGYGPMDRSTDVLWIVLGAIFLRNSDSVQRCQWLVKCCYMWTMWDTYDRGSYTDRVWKACGMLVRFSSAGCTSIRIATTLEYEYCLFVAVIT